MRARNDSVRAFCAVTQFRTSGVDMFSSQRYGSGTRTPAKSSAWPPRGVTGYLIGPVPAADGATWARGDCHGAATSVTTALAPKRLARRLCRTPVHFMGYQSATDIILGFSPACGIPRKLCTRQNHFLSGSHG